MLEPTKNFGILWICLLVGCLAANCKGKEEKADFSHLVYKDESPDRTAPPPRDPGPPQTETKEQLDKATTEATNLVKTLSQSGILAREIASLADIRGYRFYRKRFFGQAQIWFEIAVKIDPLYELSLYNAARTAALLGDLNKARTRLKQLEKLKTPMSQRRLQLSLSDPDFSALK